VKFVVSQLLYLVRQRELRGNLARLLKLLIVLGVLIIVFAEAFHLIMTHVENREHSWITGVYWTLTVMSTLGFGDITFTSDLGRLFSIIVLLSGIFLLLIVLPFAFIRFFYAPWLEAQIRLRAPRGLPEGTRGHVVICRLDAIGRDLIEKLRLAHIPHYVLEANAALASELHADGVSVVAGDPEAPATWAELRIRGARAIVANLDDATNANIVLTIRQDAPDVEVVAIAEHAQSVDVLEMSGASHVLSVKQRLGEHLANRVNAGHSEAHPIGTFRGLVVAEFPVHNTPLVGRTLRDIALRRRMGINVVGVWERGRFEPAHPDMMLSDSSVPVVVGTPDQLLELNAVLVIYDTNYSATLVLGGGRVGRAASQALKNRGVPVHVVERDPALAAVAGAAADQVFIGDGADREVLERAGIASAPAVLLTTNDDSTNIYLTLYCRRLNPALRIISRITHVKNLEAIHRAGADFVLSYSLLGAEAVFSHLERRGEMMFGAGLGLFQVTVPKALVGQTIAECDIGARTGLNVVAVQEGNTCIPSPPADLPLTPTGELLMLGTDQQRRDFERTFG
jgi:voltage-gated potassium channel